MANCGGGDGGRSYFGGGSTSVLLQTKRPLEPFFLSSSSSFLGSSSMVSFEDVCGGGKRSGRPFFCTYDQEENGDDDYDEFLNQPEKKRRLSIEQVQFLEKSFETENKLEPERKVQLAKELGLQPRQVAIWFQNRRARWKTKQMEKDFDTLQASYNNMKCDYENLLKEKENLKAEVAELSDKLRMKEQSSTIERDPIVESASESNDQHISIFGYNKQDDLSSAKSDIIDSDSPRVVDAANSSAFAEPGSDSSYAFEATHSDISQDDEDYVNMNILPSSHDFTKIEHDFTKIEEVEVDPSDNSCHFGVSGDDHAYLFWGYSM